MEVVVHLSVLEAHGGGGDGGREVEGLLHAYADTAILVQAVEHVALTTRHDLLEGGGVSLGVDDAHRLLHVRVYDEDLAWVEQEQLVAGGGREGHLETVVEREGLLAPAQERGREGGGRREVGLGSRARQEVKGDGTHLSSSPGTSLCCSCLGGDLFQLEVGPESLDR